MIQDTIQDTDQDTIQVNLSRFRTHYVGFVSHSLIHLNTYLKCYNNKRLVLLINYIFSYKQRHQTVNITQDV